MPPRDQFRPYMNADLGNGPRAADPQMGEGLPTGIRGGDAQPAGTIGFDQIFRRSYTAPPTSGVTLACFTVGQDTPKGMITGFGIGSPQFDFFGANEYFLSINGSAPMDQQFSCSTLAGPDGSFFGGLPAGSLQFPKRVNIQIKTSDQVGITIAPQATPAAGAVVYNVWIRLSGYLWR